ncbi:MULTISPECIES: PH domain-containing protein [Bacillaceae]|uniref:PH domain-containing protein n=1 Tax=Bacillaceae TaxID=186817 RepID=UPI002FFF69C4
MNREPSKKISAKALTVWRISGVIKSAIEWSIVATVLFLVHLFDWPNWISIIMIALGIIFTILHIFLFPTLRWKQWRYDVREEEVELQEGIFVLRRTLVPMIRVQHVDTVQGPLLRKYQLASVIIHTAATAHEIPALEMEEAEELRLYISNLTKVAEEDV